MAVLTRQAEQNTPIHKLPGFLSKAYASNTHLSEQNPTEQLQTAFEVFNDISKQLAGSYAQLEQRVADLSSELDVVTEQRLSELTQKEQLANRLETLLNCLPGGVVVLDKYGKILENNPAAELCLEPQLQGKLWREVIARCFDPKEDDGHEVSNHQGKRISIVTRSLDQDGQIILLTDQTETRQLQAELSRHERLSALGKVVSTLAHQVRTPLSSALLYAKHLQGSALSVAQQQNFSNKLINSLHYMERQVRDMLLFVKGELPLRDTLTLNAFIQVLSDALEAPLSSVNTLCNWQVDTAEHHLKCNVDALVGALLNLVNNSQQACKQVELVIKITADAPDLHIYIYDNGPGISADDLSKAKDLFFTTKSQGTGIGLSVVNHVAHSHGGRFILKNGEAGGVCAELHLPIITDQYN
ncbi:MAG: PAS domain-containing sensor histidine kinase [Cellvibrionaceae bacterium]|nr:PAS domain-containing sensor histidine kinase [Cellvibrionaceae bacterium]